MARVTVEDCILNVPNRFELVLLSSKRARELGAGAALTVARDNDKNPVVALREISEKSIDIEGLRTNLIRGMQKYAFSESNGEEDENLDDVNEWKDSEELMLGEEDASFLSEDFGDDADDILSEADEV